jgi:aspartate/methionine/tyrosine aminotransferase
MPSDDTIATLDARNNLLLVCDELYQQLSHDDRGRILTTRHAVVDVERILQAA